MIARKWFAFQMLGKPTQVILTIAKRAQVAVIGEPGEHRLVPRNVWRIA